MLARLSEPASPVSKSPMLYLPAVSAGLLFDVMNRLVE
jgi:hypothetical protein